MDRITLPKNSTDSFITLLIYSDRGAMIAVENITEIQSYVGSTESRDFNKSFSSKKFLAFLLLMTSFFLLIIEYEV